MKTYKILGYAGVIPFIIFLSLFQYPVNDIFIDPLQGFTFYSAIIFSFIAGSLWRSDNSASNLNAQIISNILCLYAFVCLFLSTFYALLFLSFGYFILFVAEYLITNVQEDTPAETQSYLRMRLVLTLVVNLLHSIAIVLLI
ncbi:DUF3429 domain-containing protein [Pseudocolwellia sp. HL-MZ19]|uniref:DUF3429 domain-containing protein n=1 Tax=unclassified Pseudocolwellia TaxID=2848178 RepID=UPI003CE8572E